MTAAGEISNDRNPKFPVGMRVLAVDDDPTCLKLLDTLLSKCQYHVTTTGQAVTALKMLRENKNMFDLVISDVCMPDMNGFKLLELVGLEMDLPVIMLSAHGDTEHVMKGISHGACDYLLKPVRIEELRNIWQHVIRRKKIDIKDQKSFDQTQDDNVEDFTKAAEVYQNDKISRKRKDKNGDEYEEHDQDGDHNEDPSWQKKPRLVWTPELHRLFVAAVNQLGIDKAVPKRILETMNVENVTRENVASHLQKYRVSLKRMSEEASHQANMASVLRRADSSYLRGGSVNGFGDLHSSGMSGQIQNSAFGSFPQGGVLGRLNSPGLCILGLSSSGIQRHRPQTNLTTLGTGVSNLQSRVQHENQNGNILQGVPLSLGLDQLQLNQNNSHIGELSVCSNESNIYANSNVFPNCKTVVGSSIKSFSDVQNNPVAVENHLQSTQKDVVPGNHYSVLSNTLNSECSQSLDYKRFDDTWLDANKSSMNLPNTCTSDYFNQSAQRNVRLIPTVPVQMGTIAHARLSDQRSELQRQVALVSSSASQNMNLTQKRHSGNWDGYKSPMSNMINSSIDSSISPQYDTGLMGQRLDSESMGSYQKHDGSLAGQSNLLDPMLLQHNKVEQPAAQATTELNYGSLMGQWNPNSSYAHSKADSLEDLVAVMMKEEEWMLNTNGGGEFGIGCI